MSFKSFLTGRRQDDLRHQGRIATPSARELSGPTGVRRAGAHHESAALAPSWQQVL